MALFDLNSRYTKSMEHGGSYERDASIGGYNRKELRGLNKQAKRGTLTQRERARLKYLTDERRGRRKRGLLSGLGGAAATLGALAAAGKLGEGEGGEGRGAALMDAIKLRLAEGKVNAKDKLELLNDKRLARKLGVDPREYVDDSPASAVTEDVSSDMQLPRELRDTPGADLISDVQGGGEMTRRVDEMEGDGRGGEEGRMQRQRTSERNDQYVTDRDANLAEKTAFLEKLEKESKLDPGLWHAAEVEQPYKDLEDKRLAELMGLGKKELPGGPVARRGTSPLIPSPDGSQPLADEAISDIIRQMRSDADEEEAAMSSNSPTNINEVTGLRSRSVDLGSDFPAELPARTNIRPIESSNNQPPAVDPNDVLTRIKNRTGSRPVRANSVDPMGLLGGDSRDENVSEAQREEDAVEFLSLLNRKRVEKGLPEVNKITMDAIKETGRSTSELMNSRQFGQIPTNRSKKNLPQLEALQQLRSILGNRYR